MPTEQHVVQLFHILFYNYNINRRRSRKKKKKKRKKCEHRIHNNCFNFFFSFVRLWSGLNVGADMIHISMLNSAYNAVQCSALCTAWLLDRNCCCWLAHISSVSVVAQMLFASDRLIACLALRCNAHAFY